ncbi:MAG: ATP-binding cassette domain-containing protein [Bacteroidales bacterium]
MSVKIEKVTKIYGTQKALDQLSLDIPSGEVVGLLGPNGAGKSTLMKILSCYIAPSSGKVSICGLDAKTQSLQIRKILGYLPEHNPLYLEMYVREYLRFVGEIYLEPTMVRSKVEEVICLVNFGKEADKKIGALSKGYRQRLGIAQALVHNPEVLILDEPTSGLDPNQLEEIRHLIRQIGEQKTVILSTHIMQEVEALCGRVVVLHEGKMVADAPTHELLQAKRDKIKVKVEFDQAVLLEDLSALQGVLEVVELGNNQYQLLSHVSIDLRPILFQYAVDKNLAVLTLQKEEEKLESIFQQLTIPTNVL